jgi:hypothetical protein
MSSEKTGDKRPATPKGRLPDGATRQASAEELLAEFRQALESAGYPPIAPASSASAASASPPAAGPQKAAPPRSRRWKLVASGLALGLVAASAGFALVRTAPAPESPGPEVLAERQSDAQPPVEKPPAPSSDVAVKDGPHSDPAQAGGPDAGADAKETTATTPARPDADWPADGSNAMAAALSTDSPALTPAAASASTALKEAPPESVGNALARPDGTGVPAISPNSPDSTPPNAAPTPHDKAAAGAAGRSKSGRPAKTDAAARPTVGKTSAKKAVAKSEKARAAPEAQAPHPPPRPAPPDGTDEAPAAQAAADPAAAAPSAPTSFAAQSIGQVTHAFGYVTHLPAALVERVMGQNSETK